MAFWWVSQNKSFRHERKGGYLWAPLLDKAGNPQHHWETLARVSAGDIIFSYFDAQIIALSTARGTAYTSRQPEELRRGNDWTEEGRKIDVAYQDLPHPLRLIDFRDELVPMLPSQFGPLNISRRGNQGYLYPLPDNAGQWLLAQVDAVSPEQSSGDLIAASLSAADVPETTRRALVAARVGQGLFRRKVLQFWRGQCSVSGLAIEALLRASHIKPWQASNNAERLDPNNGLALSPAYDAAFDAGFISFRDNGSIIYSATIEPIHLEGIGITNQAIVRNLNTEHRRYLEYHREVELKR